MRRIDQGAAIKEKIRVSSIFTLALVRQYRNKKGELRTDRGGGERKGDNCQNKERGGQGDDRGVDQRRRQECELFLNFQGRFAIGRNLYIWWKNSSEGIGFGGGKASSVLVWHRRAEGEGLEGRSLVELAYNLKRPLQKEKRGGKRLRKERKETIRSGQTGGEKKRRQAERSVLAAHFQEKTRKKKKERGERRGSRKRGKERQQDAREVHGVRKTSWPLRKRPLRMGRNIPHAQRGNGGLLVTIVDTQRGEGRQLNRKPGGFNRLRKTLY